MERRRQKGLACACSAFAAAWYLLCGAVASAGETFTLQLLHVSDLEGGPDCLQYAPRLAAIIEALQAEHEPSLVVSSGDNYIAGLFFSVAADPELQAAFRQALEQPQCSAGAGRLDVALLELLGVEVTALGNHEFDQGTAALAALLAPDIRDSDGDGRLDEARWLGPSFPIVAANLDFSGDSDLAPLFTQELLPAPAFRGDRNDPAAAASKPKLTAATWIERGGQKIVIVGLTTPRLEQLTSSGGVHVLGPGAGTDDLAAMAAQVQPVIDAACAATGSNKVVLLAHLQQLQLERALTPLLHNVDIVVGGGSDTLLADGEDVIRGLQPGHSPQGEYPLVIKNADGDPALLVNVDGHYRYVGRLVAHFDDAGRILPERHEEEVSGVYAATEEQVARLWNERDPYAGGTRAARMRDLLQAFTTVVTAKDAVVRGRAEVYLNGARTAVRTEETNLGDLVADAILAAAQDEDRRVVAALISGGDIRESIGSIADETDEHLRYSPTRANSLSGKQAGEISQLDIEGCLRFDNPLAILTATAADLRQLLEHGLSGVAPGATPGRFPQVAGLAISFDPNGTAASVNPQGELDRLGTRIRSLALVRPDGSLVDLLVRDGELQGDPQRPIRVATIRFLADGGDNYPWPALGSDRVDLPKTEQQALADHLQRLARSAASAFTLPDVPAGLDGRIQNLSQRSDNVLGPRPTGELQLELRSRIALPGVEITAFDSRSRTLWVAAGALHRVDLNDPSRPRLLDSLRPSELGCATDLATSIAVGDGLVAAAVPADTSTRRGQALVLDLQGRPIQIIEVGHVPDMLTFDKQGRLIVVNEGEASADYDPPGSISILARLGRGHRPIVRSAAVADLDAESAELQRSGLRLLPGCCGLNQLEPEYACVTPNGRYAVVALQEHSALAWVDLERGIVERIVPLELPPTEALPCLIDLEEDSAANLRAWPVSRLPQPDGIACWESGGKTYYVTANEGEPWGPRRRLAEARLDPATFPQAVELQQHLTDVVISDLGADTDGDGDFDHLQLFGGRSMAVWDEAGRFVFDSGATIEQLVAAVDPAHFNFDSYDHRPDVTSTQCGPEPEGLALGRIDGQPYAFLGLERGGGVIAWNLAQPRSPHVAAYAHVAGDAGPEGLTFIPANESPNGESLLVVANEVSLTLTIYAVFANGTAAATAEHPAAEATR